MSAPVEVNSMGADSPEVARVIAAGVGLGRVYPRRSDLKSVRGLEFGVDQKSHDLWVMTMKIGRASCRERV